MYWLALIHTLETGKDNGVCNRIRIGIRFIVIHFTNKECAFGEIGA